MNMNFTTSDQVRGAIAFAEMQGMTEFVEELKQLLPALEEKERIEREEEERKRKEEEERKRKEAEEKNVIIDNSIYETLKYHSKYKPIAPEKLKCIEDTVNYLLEEGPDAEQPGLLLGKIQCGKTDTFVNVIGHAMDRGIDIAVVFTKGTNALAEQTVSRMGDEFKFFEYSGRKTSSPVIAIYDIMAIKDLGIPKDEFLPKNKHVIIICKKEDDNLKYLLRLFKEDQPLLLDQKILVVDDEADFASWNYMKSAGKIKLAKITELINEFIHTPRYCRYLQVTATPYSLYLQPDNTITVGDLGEVRPLKPRFTTLVPTHSGYVGGDQYFKESQNEESMYSYLFHPIDDDCMKVLKNKNMRYVNNILTSMRLYDFRYAIMSYLIGTIIRKIQQDKVDEDYRSSCLIHLEVSNDKQVWQELLVKDLITKIHDAYTKEDGDTKPFEEMFDDIYADFSESNKIGRESGLIDVEFPSWSEVLSTFKQSLAEIEPNRIVHVVNSVRGVKELLNKKDGQLRLTSLFNIFIGGSILDRGITINNMISFFYGRQPGVYQQDTVLQHMRQYGNRSKADMSVTRLHTTEELYEILEKMNELDNRLRDCLINKDGSNPDLKAVFVACAANGSIQPCAKGKIIVSNTVTITPGFRKTVSGFQTGPKSSISKIIDKIDQKLQAMPGYCVDDFFLADGDEIVSIIREIRKTFVYDEEPNRQWGNYGWDWNEEDMIGSLAYCMTGVDDNKVHLMIRTNKDMSRVRKNGRFVDAPDTGSTDLDKARETAVDRPAIMLFRENGSKEQGWRGTPFYWPVLVSQQNIDSVIFTVDGNVPDIDVTMINYDSLLDGIDPSEVLFIHNAGKDRLAAIDQDLLSEVCYPISAATQQKMLQHDILGGVSVNTEVCSSFDSLPAGINSYNDGKFPFLLQDYKYIVLTSRGKNQYNCMLVKIDTKNPYIVVPTDEMDEDTLIDYNAGSATDIEFQDATNWAVVYNIKKMRTQTFTPNKA